MKIYTRTGDDGTTSLVGGARIEKNDIRIEAYGTVDELMSNVGYLRDLIRMIEHFKKRIDAQMILPQTTEENGSFSFSGSPSAFNIFDKLHTFDVGNTCSDLVVILNKLMICSAILATQNPYDAKIPQITDADVKQLETWTDLLQEGLPTLRHFTLPCGHPLVSYSHVCRTVCRRAERHIVAVSQQDPVPVNVLAYINRLSDYFYALGRYLTLQVGAEELIWESR